MHSLTAKSQAHLIFQRKSSTGSSSMSQPGHLPNEDLFRSGEFDVFLLCMNEVATLSVMLRGIFCREWMVKICNVSLMSDESQRNGGLLA